jgi:hypothetical protein
MKKNSYKSLLMATLAMAGLAGAGQVAQAHASEATTVQYKATTKTKAPKQKIVLNDVTGGLDFDRGNPFGMTPKEYGIRFGNGGSKRSNRLRYSHNAKLKRRRN